MDYKKAYEEWINNSFFDIKIREELEALKDNEEEIEDRFYKNLEFGTAGLRGKIGAGTNRMNIYNVSKVTQGLADFIIENGEDYMNRGAAIAFDCRHYSDDFAKTAALVLAANGIKVYLFESLRPTPELSYTVRRLHTAAGIVVTASHNPKDYNGYKVYWEDGAQILSPAANAITEKVNNINSFDEVKTIDEKEALEKGLLNIIGEQVDYDYLEKVRSLAIRDNIDKNIKIVYTPLNGTGNIPVRRVLNKRGFKNVVVVPEQEMPDPNFTTVGYPNPEDPKAFKYAENLGKEVDAELLLATDPDCDRLAIEVRDASGEYIPFNGNQTGAVLIKYIVEGLKETNKLPKNPVIIKSIVTGDLGKAIAADYGVKTFEALTGFKNICGKIPELEQENQNFIFGYEESIGYVAGTFVRDKDAVMSAMLLCEATAYYKTQGKTLIDVLNEIYEYYGYYREKQISIVLEGSTGKARIERMMESFRTDLSKEVGSCQLVKYIDYREQKIHDLVSHEKRITEIAKSNVLRYFYDDGSWYAIRPSGTEPKIKIYIYTRGKTLQESEDKINVMEGTIMNRLDSVE